MEEINVLSGVSFNRDMVYGVELTIDGSEPIQFPDGSLEQFECSGSTLAIKTKEFPSSSSVLTLFKAGTGRKCKVNALLNNSYTNPTKVCIEANSFFFCFGMSGLSFVFSVDEVNFSE